MHFSKVLMTSLVTLAVAQPVHHLHQKREPAEVYVTTHYTVTANAQQDQQAPAPTSAAPEQPQQQDDDTQNKQAQQQQTTMSSKVASASSSTSDGSSSTPSSSGDSGSGDDSSSSGDSSSPNKGTGITYSPYSQDGGCKSASDVKKDVSALSEYSYIRIYGVDCDQVSNVVNALGDNQKVFLGLYDTGNLENDLKSMKEGVKGNWDKVHTVSIGNELVNGGQAKPSEVKQMTSKARDTLKGYGYKGPVVAVDTFIATINNPELCDASDYIAVNAHAFFDGNVGAEDAGKWAKEQIQKVSKACGGKKKVLITESGWPSKGDTNGKAVPSPQNMKAAIKSLQENVGDEVCLFSAFNDMWKSPGFLNVEQYWGIHSD